MTDQAAFEYDVFLSYSHADGDWVKTELLPALEAAGLKINIDFRDFEIGTPSSVNMERAIDHSRHTLLVLTPKWVTSEWTGFESLLVGTIDPAGRRRKLFPLMLEKCEPPRRIAMLTYADFTDPSRRGKELSRLVEQLKSTAPASAPAEETAPVSPSPTHTIRQRPARGGDSIGSDSGGAATLGCLVCERDDSSVLYVLSDFTGLCDLNGQSRRGDPILQPGRPDGGNRAQDLIATLDRWASVRDDSDAASSNLSAAIARVRRKEDVSPELRIRGMLTGIASAVEGAEVWIVGRTSGETKGKVLRTGVFDEIPCSYYQIEGGTRSSGDGTGFFPVPFGELIECTHMLEPGDSGAILVDADNRALGLGFAGSKEVGLFLPIQKVLDALKVDLVTAANWTPSPEARS